MGAIWEIIRRCGGVRAIAEAVASGEPGDLERKRWAIHKWPKNGIPERHWAALMSLGDITVEELHAANEALRQAA
jgi:hypothetical protein